ncbi:M20/M25/M40 family metallo-hydrolase [Patescibacteria group bacterium]|nr:M20/M25/M40 family metallo-hydrolase [Patescibacteria group bacterium]MBP9709893.1 M20/M25/M40 family metallo-hydrolase [Patescibacteria group bacterium]
MSSLEHLVDLTETLIRIRSTHAQPEQILLARNLAANYFDSTSLLIEPHIYGGIPSLTITKHTKTPKVFLCGHLDVVDGEDEQFIPRRDGARLYGRGALDMKSGNAVLMALMKDLADTSHDVGLMLTGDEEIGGMHGTKVLLEQGYRPQVAIIPDGGLAIHRLVEKEKGVIWIRLEAQGAAAHGSRPWEGINAIDRLMDALQKIKTLFADPHTNHPTDHWVSTINIGHIEGGHSVNKVPSSASATCDIRYTEHANPNLLLEDMKKVLPEHVTLDVRFFEPMTHVDIQHPLIKPFFDVISAHSRTPEVSHGHGSSDGRFFSAHHIPVLISQPDGANHHAKDEWVNIPSIKEYYDVLRAYLDKVAL